MSDLDRAIDFITLVASAHHDDLVDMAEGGLDDEDDLMGLKADVADFENVLAQLQRLSSVEK